MNDLRSPLCDSIVPPVDRDNDTLERFVALCLEASGAWPSARTSDGVPAYRVVERTPDRVGVCGRIYEIDDQSLHPFWLEVEREPLNATTVRWTVYFGAVLSMKRRHVRHAEHLLNAPGEMDWRLTMSGRATLRDGGWTVVADV